jgi:hypothetical protein
MSWNIKTPGDYINGPLTVAGVTQFISNVGIGISPATNLHVASSGNTLARIESTGTGAGSTSRLQFKNASGASDLRTGVIEWYDVGVFKGDLRFLKNGGVEIRNASDSATFNLTDSGNLGLSVSPATWSTYKAIGINNQGFHLYSNIIASIGGIVSNGYHNGTNWIYLNSATSGRYEISGSNHAFYGAPSGSATNPISGANAFVNLFNINSNGAAALSGGSVSANGVGLTFPDTQVASSNANTLDDYEEGTWTPTITAETGTIGATVLNSANYTKVGRLVSVTFDITITTAGTGTGGLKVSMPFSPSVAGNACGALREYQVTGNMGQVYKYDATHALCNLYNNSTLIVANYRIMAGYTYFV